MSGGASVDPFRPAVRFWGKTTQIPSDLPQKQDYSVESVSYFKPPSITYSLPQATRSEGVGARCHDRQETQLRHYRLLSITSERVDYAGAWLIGRRGCGQAVGQENNRFPSQTRGGKPRAQGKLRRWGWVSDITAIFKRYSSKRMMSGCLLALRHCGRALVLTARSSAGGRIFTTYAHTRCSLL